MFAYALKVLLSAIVLVAAAEVAKRSHLFGALIVSLPLVSVLSLVWLWRDTGDPLRVADYAAEIPWLVLPSLVLFLVLPALLRHGWSFWSSLLSACIACMAAYGLTLLLLKLARS